MKYNLFCALEYKIIYWNIWVFALNCLLWKPQLGHLFIILKANYWNLTWKEIKHTPEFSRTSSRCYFYFRHRFLAKIHCHYFYLRKLHSCIQRIFLPNIYFLSSFMNVNRLISIQTTQNNSWSWAKATKSTLNTHTHTQSLSHRHGKSHSKSRQLC